MLVMKRDMGFPAKGYFKISGKTGYACPFSLGLMEKSAF
jgi:hypothetical protein